LTFSETIVYGTADGANTFSVIAVEITGNDSEPATRKTDLDRRF
jgi:hypothetical protein